MNDANVHTVAPVRSAIIRLHEVLQTVGLSAITIYQMVMAATFPQQIKLGTAAVGWLGSDVEQWIAEQVDRRGGSMPEAGLELLQRAA